MRDRNLSNGRVAKEDISDEFLANGQKPQSFIASFDMYGKDDS